MNRSRTGKRKTDSRSGKKHPKQAPATDVSWWSRLPIVGVLRAGLVESGPWDLVLPVGVLLLIIISRCLAFPSTIWDQDEANFALAVIHFDPLHNQPHAPFFPLWIVLGKIARSLLPGVQAQDALRIVSVIASVWIFFPLRSLWSLMLSRAEATAAALLFLFMPAPWILSGRAYSEPTATALLIGGLALWLRSDAERHHLFWGGTALAAAVLVRPQWVLLVLPITLWRLSVSRNSTARVVILFPPLTMGLATGAIVVWKVGGMTPLLAAVEQHRRYIVQAGSGFSWEFGSFAVNRALGGLVPGVFWMLLCVAGLFLLVKSKSTRRSVGVLTGLVLLPQVLQLLLAQNPTLPRYALPILALSSGLVVAALRIPLNRERHIILAVGVGLITVWIVVVPSLNRYRHPSPVISAFRFAGNSTTDGLIACDRRLVAFVTLLGRTGELPGKIIWDYQIELGRFTRSFSPDNSAIILGRDRGWIAQPDLITHFTCDDPLLRTVASPRFLDLSVIRGCAFIRPLKPSIRPEQLRPGAVIPVNPG